MPYVYRVHCKETGKSYVGATTNYKNRIEQHKYSLRAGDHHSKDLQKDFNKYGESSIVYEKLEKVDRDDLYDTELEYMVRFDSVKNGYNTNDWAAGCESSEAVPCTWNGIEYDSLSAAARANGVTTRAMQLRIENGYEKDGDISHSRAHHPHKIECTWNGKTYESLAQAAKDNGYSAATFGKYIKRGFRCDADVEKYRRKTIPDNTVRWNGKNFSNKSKLAAYCGVSIHTVRYRLKKGYTCDEDIKPDTYDVFHGRKCVWRGVEYESIVTAAKDNNVSWGRMCRWLRTKEHEQLIGA